MPAPKYDYDSAWLLYLAGAAIEEIARIKLIPYSQLQDYSQRHGWRARRAEARERSKASIKEDLQRRIETNRIKHQNFVLDQLEETAEVITNTEIGNEEGQMTIGAKLGVLKQHDDIARKTLKLDEEKNNDPIQIGFAILTQMRANLVNESPKPIENGKTLDLPETSENTLSGISILPANQKPNLGIISSLQPHQMNGSDQDLQSSEEFQAESAAIQRENEKAGQPEAVREQQGEITHCAFCHGPKTGKDLLCNQCKEKAEEGYGCKPMPSVIL